MTLTSVQLWERIHAAGLATSDECRQWAIEVAQTTSQEALFDPGRLATELIKRGRISSFQANVLFHNLGIKLVHDNYKLTKSLETEVGKDWFEAQSSVGDGLAKSWFYLQSPQKLNSEEVRRNPPSLNLAERMKSANHPSLDRWPTVGISHSNVIAVCDALEGQPLASYLNTARLSWDESVSMIEQLAAGLSKLHEVGLVHGRICTTTVFRNQDTTFTLRRDPLFLPMNPFESNGTTCFGNIQEDLIAVAAPELTLPASFPTVQSDLYALGCLWYESSVAEPLFEAAKETKNGKGTPEAWARSHSLENLSLKLHRAVPAHFVDCLARLVAKNPSDRFTCTAELIRAIDLALRQPQQTKQISPNPELPVKAEVKPNEKAKTSTQPPLRNTQKTVEPLVPKMVQDKPASTKNVPKPIADKPIGDKPKTLAPSVSVPIDTVAEKAAAQLAKKELIEAVAIESTDVAASDVTPLSVSELPANRDISEALQATESSNTTPSIEKANLGTAKKKKKSTKKRTQSSGAGDQATRVKKKVKKAKPKWVVPALIAGTCIFFASLLTVLLQNGTKTTPTANDSQTVIIERQSAPTVAQSSETNKSGATKSGTGAANITSEPVDTIAEYYSVGTDDGKTLWAPPQTGSPYSTEMLPAGLEAVVFLSGNAWHQRSSLASLGKWWIQGQPSIAKLIEKYSILSDPRIDSVAIGLYPSKTPGVPQALFRIKMNQSVPIESIANGMQGFEAQLLDAKSGSKRGFWSNESSSDPIAIAMDELTTDKSSSTKKLTVGPQELVISLGEQSGGLAPLRRQFEQLLKTTDSRSDMTLLFAPSFLFGEGRELISAWPNLSPFLREKIDDTCQAIVFSMSFDPSWYSEIRMMNAETRELGRYASQLKSQLETLPDQIEAEMLSTPSHPYWRALSQRFPQMLRSFNKFSRFGVEDGQVIINAYLPKEAAGNLLIASWMALTAPSGANSNTLAAGSKTAAKPQSKSIEEILESKINVSFDQESLESALQFVASEVSDSVLGGDTLSMTINGTAFQKDGITKAQQIRNFKQASVPLRAVLTDLVRRANPVTTVQSPKEKDQKVVWIVTDSKDTPAKKSIELTTRAWVESNNVTLPGEFLEP